MEAGATAPRWPAWLPIVLILALAAVVRFYRLGAENFWVDEVLSLGQTHSLTEGLAAFYRLADLWSGRPYALLLLHYALLFGDSEFVARLPYAVLSIADVGLLFLVIREIADRRVALRAALFLAVLPLHVWYAQEARWYAQWSFLSTLSFWALVRAWKTDRLRWWAVYGLGALLSLFTYVVAIQSVAVQAASAWLLPGDGGKWRFRVRVAIVLAIVAILAWPVFTIAPDLRVEGGGGGVGTPRATTPVVLPYTFFALVAGYTVGPTVAELHAFPSPGWILRNHPEIVLYFAFFGAIALLGVWSVRKRRAAAAILLPWAVGLPLLVFASAVVAGQTYNVRYAFPAAVGLAALLSLGIESLGRWRTLGTLAAVGLFAYSLGNHFWNPRYDKEHAREALAFVRQSPHADAPVAQVGQGLQVAEHYGHDLTILQLHGCRASEPEEPQGPSGIGLADLGDEPAWWLMVMRDWSGYGDVCLQSLPATHAVVARQAFPGVSLLLVRRR